MAGAGWTRTVLRWPAGFATLVVLLATAGSAPTQAAPLDGAALYALCRTAAHDIAEKYRDVENVSVSVNCERPDGTSVDPKLWFPAAPSRPAPTPVTTAGHRGCVTGPGRPVVGTTLTSVSATAGADEEIVYEHQQLDGKGTVDSTGAPIREFGPGELAPGASYRWRARVDDTPDDEQGWSPWCEFTVSADAVDYRGLGDVSLEALNELRLRPDRKYAVSLSGRQQRLLRAGTDVGRTSARMTLTGPRWTDLLVQLSEAASIADEVAADVDEGDWSPPDGSAYRTLVDAISSKLGGPHHPRLG